jgi:hypothetical protein
MHSWLDEPDSSPFPYDLNSEQLRAHIVEILDNHYALDDSHSEQLVRMCRANALESAAHGHHGTAQEWRNYANSLNEAAAIRSEVADKLRARFEND